MATRKILTEGDELLRKKCRPVEEINAKTLILLDDMAKTMYKANGVGLAAPQVGILKRIVVIDVGDGLVEMINPRIVMTEGSQIGPEGCLSVPGVEKNVERPKCVVCRALDREGNEVEYHAEDLFARCICHELDHLDGVLFIDKAREEDEN
ncbi:MAG: peptide deformylase [Eubacteriales bacterium]|nr:peptide deformylase [Eubacteriales bacterium]